MLFLTNASAVYNPTNKTQSDGDSIYKLILAEKFLYILTAILTVIGNTLVLLVTWRERSLHQPNKYFIACLAVADLLVGIFIGPLWVHQLNFESQQTTSLHLCRFIVWIDTSALTASIYTLTFISFDRYLKISKPLQYRSRMTTSRSLKIIFIIWFISTAFATYAATPDSGSKGILATGSQCRHVHDDIKNKVFYTFVLVGVFFIPTIIIIVMYALIFIVAHKRQKMLRNGELGETCTGPDQRSGLRQDLKIVRMLLIVIGVFLFCWFPYVILNMLRIYNHNIIDLNGKSLNYKYSVIISKKVIEILAASNSLCNPIIYACLDQTYREAFKRLIKRMMCQTASSVRRQPLDGIELRQLRTE